VSLQRSPLRWLRGTREAHHDTGSPADKFWAATLTALGQRLRIQDPKVDTRSTCVDSRRQWRHSRDVCHNSTVRSVLQTLAAPVTVLGNLMRGSERGMKSQPNG
jgi:hypothetical protein